MPYFASILMLHRSPTDQAEHISLCLAKFCAVGIDTHLAVAKPETQNRAMLVINDKITGLQIEPLIAVRLDYVRRRAADSAAAR